MNQPCGSAGAKAHCCPICTFTTDWKQNIRRHMRQKHNVHPPRKKDLIKINPNPMDIPQNQKRKIEWDTPDEKRIRYENEGLKRKREWDQQPENESLEQPSKKKKGEIIRSKINNNLQSSPSTLYDIRLIESFKMIIYGPSRSGKTMFVRDLLTNLNSFTVEPPKKIILIYVVWQPAYDKMKNEGLVDVFIQDNSELESQLDHYKTGEEILFIFDDMINSKNISYISNLFMVEGRHNNISLIFISQQSFRKDESFKSISNNTNYMVLMKNDRNVSDILNLAKQMTPGPQPLMLQIYRQSTKEKYSYLFISFVSESAHETKYLSHLFDENNIVRAYTPT